MRIFFVRSVFFMKKINSLVIFFRIREFFYKILGEKPYNGHESFNLVEKIRFYASRGFCQENGLFFGERLSSTFFRVWLGDFWSLAKNFQPIVTVVFLSVQSNFFRRNFFNQKNKQFDNFSLFERSFYQKFGEKKRFSAWNYQHSSGNWTLRFRRDFLRRIMFFEKKLVEEMFCTSSRFLSSFVDFARHFYQNCVTVFRWTFYEIFFRTKPYSRFIFRT